MAEFSHDDGWGSEPVRSGYCAVREGVMQQWERLYQDQEVKDVEIQLRDGERVLADSLVLKVASPVFRAMLTHDMEEKRTMTLQIDDVSSTEIRFWLRLLYTGKMDPADWMDVPCDEQELQPGPPAAFPNFPNPFQPHSPGVSAQSVPLGTGFSGQLGSPCSPGSLGGKGAQAKGRYGGPGKSGCHHVRAPPVALLLAAAALSKKYQAEWLLSVLVDVVKHRLTEASFESIVSAAVRHDIAPVRLCALEFARRSAGIRRRFDAGELPPEIMFEMQAVFPVPPCSARGPGTISI